MRSTAILLVGGSILIVAAGAKAQPPTAASVLERAIAHHDPLARWPTARLRLALVETRPDGSERSTHLLIDNHNGLFEIDTTREAAHLQGSLTVNGCSWRLDGSPDYSDEMRQELQLTCDRLAWLRDYYTYLWGLPMKLRDPGTRVAPEVVETIYDARPVWAVRVTYDEDVGSDIWYFYFDQQTDALAGYRFFHHEAAGDGEHILLQGESEVEGMRVPTVRSWYTNNDSEFLGTDTLVGIEVVR